MDEGLFPYTKRYLGSLDSHFSRSASTASTRWSATSPRTSSTSPTLKGIGSPSGCSTASAPDGRVPGGDRSPVQPRGHAGRGTTYRFARRTARGTPTSCRAGTPENPYYTNSSPAAGRLHRRPVRGPLAPGRAADQVHRGTVLHLYMAERVSSPTASRSWSAGADPVPPALPHGDPTFSICPAHGYLDGEQWTCRRAGDHRVWTRVMGYHRPVSSFNVGKKGEQRAHPVHEPAMAGV